MPKVSVVISTYNRSHLVSQAIESVLNQTFKDLEIIVVDDGSTDNTRQVLEKYSPFICYIYQENKGRAAARNTGIKAVKAEYVAFLDDDDLWLPNRLEKQVAFLDSHPDIGLVHTFTEVIDEQGRRLQEATKKRLKLYKKAIKNAYTYERISQLCIMFLSSVMIRKDCLDKVGFFDCDIVAFEDWDFYLRFALKYHIGTISEPLVKFRIHDMHTTKEEFIQGCIKTAMKHLKLLDSYTDIPFHNRIRYNFYMHLVNAYYMDRQWKMFRTYVFKALKLNPQVLFRSRLLLHFLRSLIPVKKKHSYPERIIPEETMGGPLTSHLKRYDFAKSFCTNKIVLDAACGVGYGCSYLTEAAREVIGIDISKEAISYAKEHYQKNNNQFKAMDVQNLGFPDKYFDVVCSFETLEHLNEPEKFIIEAKRVLKEDGIFIISIPNVKKTTYNPENYYHKIEFSRRDFEELLKKYFIKVEIFGQRRIQSVSHYYLQKIDIFHLRAILPNFLRRKICHAVATHSWDEAGLEDFVISKKKLRWAIQLIGVCGKEQILKGPRFWDSIWIKNNDDEFWQWVHRESKGVRGKKIFSKIEKYLGSIDGLKIIEVGSGAGVYSLIFACQGASVTLLDYSAKALSLAKRYFESMGISASYALGDALNLDPKLLGKFDVAMSFGTIEHFRYPECFLIAKAHLDLIRPTGIVIVSVPNRYFFPHEVLKLYLQKKGKYQLGYERSFTRGELFEVGRNLGLERLEVKGSAFISDLYRYVRIYLGTNFFQKILPIPIKSAFVKDIPGPFDNLLGADIFLIGRKPHTRALAWDNPLIRELK